MRKAADLYPSSMFTTSGFVFAFHTCLQCLFFFDVFLFSHISSYPSSSSVPPWFGERDGLSCSKAKRVMIFLLPFIFFLKSRNHVSVSGQMLCSNEYHVKR